MAKQELTQRETQLSTKGAIGKQVEHTYTVDDSFLPSPQELAAYKEIDPHIVNLLIEASVKEQEYRHKINYEKVRIIGRANRKQDRTNLMGMLFAFLSIVVLGGITAYALFLDIPWFAGLFGAGTFVSVASIFIRGNKSNEAKRKQK
jgi:uncharacterized membrane protein